MKHSHLKITAGIIVLAIASAASAQLSSAQNQHSLSARIGISYLVDSGARKALSSTGLALGLSYGIPNLGAGPTGGVTSVDLDWMRDSGNGNTLNTYTLMVVERTPLNQSPGLIGQSTRNNSAPYVGLGVGVAYNNATGGGSDSKFAFAATALAGFNFANRFYLEGAYRYNGSVNGTRADAVTLSLGVHF